MKTHRSLFITLVALVLGLFVPIALAQPQVSTVWSFSATDGAFPLAGLCQANDGALYGTTPDGGTNSKGTVFRFTPSGTMKSLWSFDFIPNTNGTVPRAGLVQATDGRLYGTTDSGGTNGDGTVFRITTNGVPTAIWSLAVPSGYPGNKSALIQGIDGAFYGTTQKGGAHTNGSVYRITTNGQVTTLWSFSPGNYAPGPADGGLPRSRLVQASDGAFYGTTSLSGTHGNGTVFRITTNGTLTSIWQFTGGADGAFPHAGLIQASDGALYGTTYADFTNGQYGTVFKITTSGQMIQTWQFPGGTGGYHPQAGLVQASDGALYGTTMEGGTNGGAYGTVFKITTSGQMTLLWQFNGDANSGYSPASDLIQASDGALYGTTQVGGTHGYGTIFKLIAPLPAQATNPVPADGATGQAISGPLSWPSAAGAPGYKVYFGTNNLPAYQTPQSTTSFDPGALAYNTTYYWRIDATNAAGTTTGVVWSFTTAAPSAPALAVSPASYVFGNVATGTTAQASFIVTNTGGLTLTGTATTVGSAFTVTGGANYSIAPASFTSIVVSFSPPATGSFSGAVLFASNGGGSTNALAGTGSVFVASRVIGMSGNLAFGNVATGQVATSLLTLMNAGNSVLTVTNIGYPTGFSGEWTGTLSAGSTTNITVTFAPLTPQSYGGSITVFSDATSGSNTITCSGTGLVFVAAAATWYVATNGSDSAAGTNWATAKRTIQAAISASTAGDVVLVTNGVFNQGGVVVKGSLTNRVAITNVISVRSVNGPSVTSIVGQGIGTGGSNGPAAVRCIWMVSGASLSGFTITGGHTLDSGGLGGSYNAYCGGGIYCDGNVTTAFISNCVITANGCDQFGGGSFFGSLYNCLIIGNTALSQGGGSHNSHLYNCTVFGNTVGIADYGGGTRFGRAVNCIIYSNSNNNHSSTVLTNCCTTPMPSGGTGNITNSPQFVNLLTSNFHLSVSSPCINAGTNQSWMVGANDLDGNTRIVNDRVDVGAYEFQPYWAWASAITNGLTNYNECATGDDYPNLLKYATGSSPTQSDTLALMGAAQASNGIFALRFNRNTNAVDVTLIAESGTSATNNSVWNGIATNVGGAGWNSANVTEVGADTPVTVTVQDNTPSATNRFLRLRVTRP